MHTKVHNYTRTKIMMLRWWETSCNAFLTHFHAPHSLIRIRGTHFQSVFKQVFQLFGTIHRLIITYHPGPSGKEKKMNLAIKQIFEKMIDQSLKEWSVKLVRGPLILSNCLQDSYRSALHLVH